MGVCCRENASEKGKYGDCFGNFLNSSDSPPPGINLGDFPLYDEDSCNSDTTCTWLADVESCNPDNDDVEDEDIVETRNNSNLVLADLDTNTTPPSNTNKILKYSMLVFIVLLVLGTMYVVTRLCILYICDCKNKGKHKSGHTVLKRAPLSRNTWSPASKQNLKDPSLYGAIIDQLSNIKITPPSLVL